MHRNHAPSNVNCQSNTTMAVTSCVSRMSTNAWAAKISRLPWLKYMHIARTRRAKAKMLCHFVPVMCMHSWRATKRSKIITPAWSQSHAVCHVWPSNKKNKKKGVTLLFHLVSLPCVRSGKTMRRSKVAKREEYFWGAGNRMSQNDGASLNFTGGGAYNLKLWLFWILSSG